MWVLLLRLFGYVFVCRMNLVGNVFIFLFGLDFDSCFDLVWFNMNYSSFLLVVYLWMLLGFLVNNNVLEF